MTFNIKYAFEAIDNFTQTAKRIGKSVQKISEKVDRASKRVKVFGDSMMKAGRGLAIGVTAPIVAAGVALIKSSDDMEHFKNRLHVTGLSANKLSLAYKKLNDFIVSTPFDNKDMQDASITMLNTGDSVDTVIKKLTKFGDVAAATNMSMNEISSMMAKAQASSRGINMVFTQMGEKGILLNKELIKIAASMGHTLTKKTLQKQVQAGYVSYKILMQAFDQLRKKGGQLHGQMAAMANEVGPLFGSFNTALVTKVLAPLGDSVVEALGLKKMLNSMINYLLKNQDKITLFIKTHKHLIKMIVAFTAIAASIAPILIALAIMVMTISALISPITLVVVGIAALAAGFAYLYVKSSIFRKSVKFLFIEMKQWLDYSIYVFKLMIDVIKGVGAVLKVEIIDPIMIAINLFKKFIGLFAHHKAANLNASQSVMQNFAPKPLGASMFPGFKMQPQKIDSSLNISLNDPGKAVKSMNATSPGSVNFDLGTNMLAARY